MSEIQCCITDCNNPFDQQYWDNLWKQQQTGWDLGAVSPSIQYFIDGYPHKDAAILIPGCGAAYEAEYLAQQGFTNITLLDISPTAAALLQQKFANFPAVRVLQGDFFAHTDTYDLIIEQTFFCALPPMMRQRYVWQMHRLLNKNGLLAGLWFDRDFENSPPFGGSRTEYEALFQGAFIPQKWNVSEHSVKARATFELWGEWRKNDTLSVQLFEIKGITCVGCKNTVSQHIAALSGVHSVSMSSNFSDILTVSNAPLPIAQVRESIAYEPQYTIEEITF